MLSVLPGYERNPYDVTLVKTVSVSVMGTFRLMLYFHSVSSQALTNAESREALQMRCSPYALASTKSHIMCLNRTCTCEFFYRSQMWAEG